MPRPHAVPGRTGFGNGLAADRESPGEPPGAESGCFGLIAPHRAVHGDAIRGSIR